MTLVILSQLGGGNVEPRTVYGDLILSMGGSFYFESVIGVT